MVKKYTKNFTLYLLAALNLVSCLKNGFDWFAYLAFGLVAVVLIWDIVEVLRHGK